MPSKRYSSLIPVIDKSWFERLTQSLKRLKRLKRITGQAGAKKPKQELHSKKYLKAEENSTIKSSVEKETIFAQGYLVLSNVDLPVKLNLPKQYEVGDFAKKRPERLIHRNSYSKSPNDCAFEYKNDNHASASEDPLSRVVSKRTLLKRV